MASKTKAKPKIKWNRVSRNWELYLLMLPAFLVILLFSYLPMFGLQIAFRNYKPVNGIWGSPWVGMDNFMRFFRSYQFKSLFQNTIFLSLYLMVASFPFPIFIALLLNQINNKTYRQTVQTSVFLPHFISLVVLVGMVKLFLSPSRGLYGALTQAFGWESTNLVGSAPAFRPIYVWSDIWQHAGWDSVIYIAALSSVDESLYEAAEIDGASRWKRVLHIDFPTMVPIIIIMLILKIGQIMAIGFEKAYLLQNQMNALSSEIISTYVYKTGIQSLQYSYATAVGLFNNFINFIMLLGINMLSRKFSDTSVF